MSIINFITSPEFRPQELMPDVQELLSKRDFVVDVAPSFLESAKNAMLERTQSLEHSVATPVMHETIDIEGPQTTDEPEVVSEEADVLPIDSNLTQQQMLERARRAAEQIHEDARRAA